MNSARTRCIINTLPVLRGQIEVAKRVGWVLCMPSFPVASPVQLPGLRPGDCNFPPRASQPSTASVASSPYGGTLLSSPVSPKQENGTSPSEALADAPKLSS
ncbi:putative Sterile alpha motif domain-containing protein [Naja naja]|nr:putative Sterile alpha motif domain-containing protein [Naja naja]